MRIAELFDEEELYREASRFVLENPGGWQEWEMNSLSPATLLKLEKRLDTRSSLFCGASPINSFFAGEIGSLSVC